MTSTTFILAPSADLANTINADVTVEAEYGSVVAKGSVYTAAHHQPGMEDLPAPCNDSNIPTLDGGKVLVSHVDLDTFGGCLRTQKAYADLFSAANQSFWNLADFVDRNGVHKLGQSGANETDLDRLHAFHAWQQANVQRTPQDEVTDITSVVHAAGDTLAQILAGCGTLLEAGRERRAAQDKLNADTLVRADGHVLVRKTAFDPAQGLGFCNHLYTDAEGAAYAAVATFARDEKVENGETVITASITISLADPIPGVCCRTIMQDLFGMKAGGQIDIAGTPRGQVMTEADLHPSVEALNAAINAAL